MQNDMICSFFGHREIQITDTLISDLTDEITSLINAGCRTFYFGGYGEFDALCYTVVSKIKRENPELNMKLVYCASRERYLYKRVRYFKREDYDEVIYLPKTFDGWYKSIYFRNCAMIDKSDFVIFYAENREGSGAYKAYKYAKSKKGKTVNLFK